MSRRVEYVIYVYLTFIMIVLAAVLVAWAHRIEAHGITIGAGEEVGHGSAH